jgi:hypothetical protein
MDVLARSARDEPAKELDLALTLTPQVGKTFRRHFGAFVTINSSKFL